VARWDLLLASSEYFADRIPGALGFTGHLIGGSPLAERAAATAAVAPAGRARADLDLPINRVIALYAPIGDVLTVDLEVFAEALADEVHLLVRSGSGAPLDVPAALRQAVRDVSGIDDSAALLAATDLVITDFGSIMFDAARLKRSVIVHAPDYAVFVSRTKGTYLDLATQGPGPITSSTQELIAAVSEWLHRGHRFDADLTEQAAQFARFAGVMEDGTAAFPEASQRIAGILAGGRRNEKLDVRNFDSAPDAPDRAVNPDGA
jgi:CDP-glycerol glycerophosphotransferase